jgi:hypothetical protein
MSYGSEATIQGKGQTFDEALRNAHSEASGGGPTNVRIRVDSIEVEAGDFVEPAIVVTVSVVD